MLLDEDELDLILEELEPQQIAFCQHLAVVNNQTKAAKLAGYSHKSARSQASRLLTNDNIKTYLAHLRAQQSAKLKDLGARVVEELALIAFSNPTDFIEFEDGVLRIKDLEGVEGTGALKSIKVKQLPHGIGSVAEIVMNDKLKSLELLGKHAALFTENIDLTSGGEKIKPTATTTIVINHRAKGQKIERQQEP